MGADQELSALADGTLQPVGCTDAMQPVMEFSQHCGVVAELPRLPGDLVEHCRAVNPFHHDVGSAAFNDCRDRVAAISGRPHSKHLGGRVTFSAVPTQDGAIADVVDIRVASGAEKWSWGNIHPTSMPRAVPPRSCCDIYGLPVRRSRWPPLRTRLASGFRRRGPGHGIQ
jgi:hypothetical protein